MFKGLRLFFREGAQDDLAQGIFDLHNGLANRAVALAGQGDWGLDDDFSLRFEFMTLLVAAALHRMNLYQGPRGEALARLWELTFEGFDFSLRQRGVMDVRMANRMQKLFQHATGRRNAYLAALERPEEPELLAAAVGRNVLNGAGGDDPRVATVLATLPEVAAMVDRLFSGLEKTGGKQ